VFYLKNVPDSWQTTHKAPTFATFMFKRGIILLSFLAYSLTLVHSIVPHHHHNQPISNHHHHESKDHDDHDEKNTVSHAFADAIHFPGSDVAIHGQSPDCAQKTFSVSEICSEYLTSLLFHQQKPPDVNVDYRQTHYTNFYNSLFLLRAPPVA
jgi:hypothetical protein